MKKLLHIIQSILVWGLLILSIGMMIFTIFSVNVFEQSNRSVFGYQFFIVQSDSMSATDFSAGDVVMIKKVSPDTLAEGDIIAYTSQNTYNYGETVTHKIRSLTVTSTGEPGFITYGTTTDTDDESVVTYPYVLGKYTGHIPGIGTFFAFLRTVPGYILCILIPFLILIGYNGLNCILLFRRYKKEQKAALHREKEELQRERIRSEQMERELQLLRARLAETQESQDHQEDPGSPYNIP